MKKRRKGGSVFFLLILLIPVLLTRIMNRAGGIAERRIEPENCYVVSGQERMPLEEYLTKAVAYYMPVEYGDEAYKAMAVVLRTYVAGQLDENGEVMEERLAISKYSMEEMEAVFGEKFLHSYSRYQKAVQATRGEVMLFEGELIEPYFHQVSAGRTNSLKGCPYLVSADSSQDMQADRYLSLLTVSVEEFASGLWKAANAKELFWREDCKAEELLAQLKVQQREGEYVQSVQWQGCEIQAARIQEIFGLFSTAFQFDAYEGDIRIMTKGMGHGFGMSLYGASRMADEGKNYREILTHYYSNITVSGE